MAAASNVEVDGKLKVDAESNTISVVKDGVETTLDLGDKTDSIDIEYINKLFAEGE